MEDREVPVASPLSAVSEAWSFYLHLALGKSLCTCALLLEVYGRARAALMCVARLRLPNEFPQANPGVCEHAEIAELTFLQDLSSLSVKSEARTWSLGVLSEAG